VEAQEVQKTAVLAGLACCPVQLPIKAVAVMARWLTGEGETLLVELMRDSDATAQLICQHSSP